MSSNAVEELKADVAALHERVKFLEGRGTPKAAAVVLPKSEAQANEDATEYWRLYDRGARPSSGWPLWAAALEWERSQIRALLANAIHERKDSLQGWWLTKHAFEKLAERVGLKRD